MSIGTRNAPISEHGALTAPDKASATWNGIGPEGMVLTQQMRFVEKSLGGAGAYTAKVDLPARALLHSIVTVATTAWTDATSALLVVGDYTTAGVAIDADGYFDDVDLLTEVAGNRRVNAAFQYYPSGAEIRAVVTAGAGGGTAGRLEIFVNYSKDPAPTNAVGVAS